MALPSTPLLRRLGLAAAGAIVLAGGAGIAYAGSLDGPADPVVETGYASVVDGDRDCPGSEGTGSGDTESGETEGTGV